MGDTLSQTVAQEMAKSLGMLAVMRMIDGMYHRTNGMHRRCQG